MNYFKILAIALCIFFASINQAYAEKWIKTTGMEDYPIYVDVDSVTQKDGGLFFNITYYKLSAIQYVVYTMYAKNYMAGVANTCKSEVYNRNSTSCLTNSTPIPKNLKPFNTTSPIYEAYNVVINRDKFVSVGGENFDGLPFRKSIKKVNQAKPTPPPAFPSLKPTGGSGTGRYSTGPISGSGSSSKGGGRKSRVDTDNEPDFGPYMRNLQNRIKMNWDPPKGDESKRVVLFFKIAKDGRLLSCSVLQSSGSTSADKAAINAVQATEPFRPLPSNFKGESVDIQFTFDYNVYGASDYNRSYEDELEETKSADNNKSNEKKSFGSKVKDFAVTTGALGVYMLIHAVNH